MADGDIDSIEGIADVVDELLALPPERFTEARNTAAKALRAEGRRDAADAVKSLPRPPLSLWALNGLAHEQPALIEGFLGAAEQLREAYRSGGDIRAATPPLREAEARVAAAAAELARAHGQNPTESVLRGLGTTLSAVASGAGSAESLRRGRLIHEPEALSLGELLVSLPHQRKATRSADTKRARREDEGKAKRLALKEEIAGARADAARARDEARAASDAAREAERQWESAKKLAEQAQRCSDTAAEHLQELQQRLKEH
ncbi:MAG: hypothetical protein M3Q31_11785 [Actinomycetota bacterium]|nr:hypothetical protein [Actinomycetota bacterium]